MISGTIGHKYAVHRNATVRVMMTNFIDSIPRYRAPASYMPARVRTPAGRKMRHVANSNPIFQELLFAIFTHSSTASVM
ncbi:hypothetical protein CQW44_33975 [Streptomyces griseofuscus]|uniref:Uncharacterized protein n=1 Tax=Streptomyces griseofuscus TaxID=146922 RepID=A0A3R8S7C1_9ACTN|nr:hypothetical protein CQW44_33975 [Streptomyces griseofuscus]